MCGLAGYANLSNKNFILDNSLLEAMQQVMIHRGPDGCGLWKSSEYQLGLVHRRLSIVDLSDAGLQPMTDKDESVVVCFNGEIYNHRILRQELELLGYTYFSQTDTETILYAYQAWGIKFLERLEGMFAIVLFDIRKNELFFIRDRIGIKPLYFSLQSNIISFASEIKALWCLPWIEKKIKRSALYHYLTYLTTPAPMTLYEGVYKLPAGYFLKFDKQRNYSFHMWYNPIVTPEYDAALLKNEQFCIDHIRCLLRQSVKKRMMADVPYGVFLSGGIDSSLNVALMAENTDKVKTFNVSFSDGPEYSEVVWARKVAQHFNTEHHEIVIQEKEAFDFFEKMVYHQDEPIGDCVCVPLYYVSKLLKDSGVTVVQVGEGSDELFCGYEAYARSLQLYRMWKATQYLVPNKLKRGLYQCAEALFPHKKSKLSFVKNWADGRELFWGGVSLFSTLLKTELGSNFDDTSVDPLVEQLCPGLQQNVDSYSLVNYYRNDLKIRDQHADELKAMTYLELKNRLPELLLMRVDKMTMATSVEGRVPFLDHKLVEFALQIPRHLKYNGTTKYILKRACEGILPRDIIYRKKMGFAAPTTRWFKEGTYFKTHLLDMLATQHSIWRDYLDYNAIAHMLEVNLAGNVDYSYHLWALQNVLACDVTK